MRPAIPLPRSSSYFGGIAIGDFPQMPAIIPDTPAVETAIIELTNAYRAKNKLGSVTPNAALTAAARAYAAYLAKSGAFSHEADGREAGDRTQAAGYDWCQVAENLAMHLDSRGFQARDLARKSVEGWINSEGHRKNLLAPGATEIGVGVAQAPDKDPKFISVQLFARPKSLEYEFQIANTSKARVTYTFGGEAHEIAPSFAITHTTCGPGTLSFDKAVTGGVTKAISMRYEAADGLVYTLKPDKAQGLSVDVARMQKLD
jgi:uncharacterized protein YkwD